MYLCISVQCHVQKTNCLRPWKQRLVIPILSPLWILETRYSYTSPRTNSLGFALIKSGRTLKWAVDVSPPSVDNCNPRVSTRILRNSLDIHKFSKSTNVHFSGHFHFDKSSSGNFACLSLNWTFLSLPTLKVVYAKCLSIFNPFLGQSGCCSLKNHDIC